MTKQFSYDEALSALCRAAAGKRARVDQGNARGSTARNCLAVAFDTQVDFTMVMMDVEAEEPELARALLSCMQRDTVGDAGTAYFTAFEKQGVSAEGER